MILTRQQVRQVDHRAIHDYGMTGLQLMENAGRGVAEVLLRLLAKALQGFSNSSVVIVCGKGNNGGDGFVIARHLEAHGIEVRVLLLCEPEELRNDAAANFAIIAKSNLSIECFSGSLDERRFVAQMNGAAWLVDALLGTGARGEPQEPYAAAIRLMNATGVPILAVDLPSGLDCDTGLAAIHTIRATHTCTFVAAKQGLLVPTASPFVGNLEVLPIGVPGKLLREITCSSAPA